MGFDRSLWALLATSVALSIAHSQSVTGQYKVIIRDGCALLNGKPRCSTDPFWRLKDQNYDIPDFILTNVNEFDAAVGFPHDYTQQQTRPTCAQQLIFPPQFHTVYLSAVSFTLYSQWGPLGSRSEPESYAIRDLELGVIGCWKPAPVGVRYDNPYIQKKTDRVRYPKSLPVGKGSSNLHTLHVEQQPQEGDNLSAALTSNALIAPELAINLPFEYQNPAVDSGKDAEASTDLPDLGTFRGSDANDGGAGGIWGISKKRVRFRA